MFSRSFISSKYIYWLHKYKHLLEKKKKKKHNVHLQYVIETSRYS